MDVSTPSLPVPTARGTMKRRLKRWSDPERIAALAALKANGNDLTRTALQLGIPKQTLWNWANVKVRLPDPAVIERARADLAAKLEALAHNLIDSAPGKIEKASLRDVMVSAGVAIDKMRLLRGEPTVIQEEKTDLRGLSDEELARLDDLAGQLVEGLGRAGGGQSEGGATTPD